MITRQDDQEIKRQFYKIYLIITRTLYLQSEPELTVSQIFSKNKRMLIGSVLFLSFAMESFINDFGGKYVDDFEELEKMESLNKFLVFPKIAKNKPCKIIKKSRMYHLALKELFKYRNYFVHYKPAFRLFRSKHERLYSELNHAKVKDLYGKMIRLLKLFNKHFKMFQGSDDWIGIYSENVTAGVD